MAKSTSSVGKHLNFDDVIQSLRPKNDSGGGDFPALTLAKCVNPYTRDITIGGKFYPKPKLYTM